MTDAIGPRDAQNALTEIDRRRDQVIRRVAMPDWYWWVLSVLTVAAAAASESGNALTSSSR